MLTVIRIIYMIFYFTEQLKVRILELPIPITKIDLGLVQCWILIELSLHVT